MRNLDDTVVYEIKIFVLYIEKNASENGKIDLRQQKFMATHANSKKFGRVEYLTSAKICGGHCSPRVYVNSKKFGLLRRILAAQIMERFIYVSSAAIDVYHPFQLALLTSA